MDKIRKEIEEHMKILKIFLTIILIITFILVGAPIGYNCFELNLAIIFIGVIFGIYKVIIKKEKLIDKKIDLLVLAFYLAPIISLIFGTYDSLEDTLIELIKNISLFNIYIIVKDLIVKDKKKGDWIISVLIAGGFFLVLLGIDERLSQTIFKYMIYIGTPIINNHENRMFSILGYANSFAIIMGIEILLSIKKLKHNKIFYSGFVYLFLLGMLLSYSRSVLAIFVVLFFLYIIFLKRKKVYVLYNSIQNIVLALLSMKIFEKLSSNNQYIFAWLSVIFFFIISIIIAKLISKYYNKICKIKAKTYLIIFLPLTVLVIIAFFIGMQFDIPLKLFKYNEENEEIRYKLYNVDSKTEYCFEFDLDANVIEGATDPIYSILIVEENKYYDTINTYTMEIGDFEGTKRINFTTLEDTVAVVIYFKSNSQEQQNGLIINSLYINNEKYELNYLFISPKLVERMKSFTITNKSLWERFVFFKDAFEIIKNNIIFGHGARGWEYNYKNIQSYSYVTKEVHNFALQIFIDNGIIGILILIAIIVYFLIKIFKTKKINEIDIAFILLTLHSIIDFNMSFYVIMMIWIILYALTIKIDKNIICKINKKTERILQISIIILNVAIICTAISTYKLKNYNKNMLEKINYAVKANNDNEAIELIKEFKEIKKNKSYIYGNLILIDYKSVKLENLQYVYETVKKEKIVANTEYNIDRNRIIKKVITTSKNEEMIQKFCEIIIAENEEMISNINNIDINRLEQRQKERYLEVQQQIYELALSK